MVELFTALTRAVEGTPLIAMTAAFIWGVLSIILSPCHLASIPLIVGFIDGQGRMSTKRAFFISSLFGVGILIMIAIIGAITGAAGRIMGDVGSYGNYFVALIFFLVGLHLLGIIPMPWSGPGQVGMKRKGMLGFWYCAWTVYIRIHGSDAWNYFQSCCEQSILWYSASFYLWNRTLLCYCFCRDMHRTGSALYELE